VFGNRQLPTCKIINLIDLYSLFFKIYFIEKYIKIIFFKKKNYLEIGNCPPAK